MNLDCWICYFPHPKIIRSAYEIVHLSLIMNCKITMTLVAIIHPNFCRIGLLESNKCLLIHWKSHNNVSIIYVYLFHQIYWSADLPIQISPLIEIGIYGSFWYISNNFRQNEKCVVWRKLRCYLYIRATLYPAREISNYHNSYVQIACKINQVFLLLQLQNVIESSIQQCPVYVWAHIYPLWSLLL